MSTIKATTLSNLAGSKTVPTDTVVDGSAKAWVNFNGTGTVSIRRAFNVSSITDNGVGDYTVNFTNAMTDANYCVTLAKQNPAGTNVSDIGVFNFVSGSVNTQAPNTGGFRIMLNQSNVDSAYVMCAIFS